MKLSQRTLFISRMALIITLAIVVQVAGLPQPITGPIINALLFITTTRMGFYAGITLGCLTPVVAVIRGQLPPILAPLMPFIMMANLILVLVFNFINFKLPIKNRLFNNFKIYAAIIFAAVTKYIFLTITVKIIFPSIIGYSVPDKIAILMMFPQLLTAVAGGILFLWFSKILDQRGWWIFDTRNLQR